MLQLHLPPRFQMIPIEPSAHVVMTFSRRTLHSSSPSPLFYNPPPQLLQIIIILLSVSKSTLNCVLRMTQNSEQLENRKMHSAKT